jgi:hypothetical protein
VGHPESVAASALHESAGEGFARRIRHCVDHDIEAAPLTLQQIERRVDLAVDRHIERHRELGAERLGQRLDALLHLVVDVREGELRAFAMHRLGDAPCDRAVGCDADDERALA